MSASLNEKFVAYFALISGIAISAVAIFYSVSGLVSIYPTAVIPIIIMGVAIEVSKISMTLWLKQNWKAPWLYKLTMIPAVIILMLITSGGVFGFLSKAHSDQGLVAGDAYSKVQLIEDKISTVKDNINTQRENITAARSALTQLDSQVNARLDRGTDEASAERAVQIRRNQRTERASLNREIVEAQEEIERLNEEIAKLNTEKAPLAGELRKVEAEVGPVKYIAALIYGDNPDANLLERAVRWVTLLIVLVMDPVAILLLLASQYSFQQLREKRNPVEFVHPITVEEVNTETTSTVTSTEVLSTTSSTIELSPPITVVDAPIAIREPLKALPIEEDNEVVNTIQELPVEELPIEEVVEVPEEIELEFEDILENSGTQDLGLTIEEETTGTTQYLSFTDETAVRVVDIISATEGPEVTADAEIEIAADVSEYVQNEEQKESSLWSATSAGSSISQNEYLEKVRKLKGLE